MSETLQMWLFGAAFGLIGVLFVLQWNHARECVGRERSAAKVEQKVDDIEKEIGTHETGIIGQLHRYSKVITRLCAKIGLIE